MKSSNSSSSRSGSSRSSSTKGSNSFNKTLISLIVVVIVAIGGYFGLDVEGILNGTTSSSDIETNIVDSLSDYIDFDSDEDSENIVVDDSESTDYLTDDSDESNNYNSSSTNGSNSSSSTNSNSTYTTTSKTENVSSTSSSQVSSELKVYFIDVGQADCILVQDNGKNMLIDAGNNPDGKYVSKYLKKLGISKIDVLVGTHPDEDHIGGLDIIIEDFTIGRIYMPNVSATTKTFTDVISAIEAKNYKVTTPKVGTTFKIGEASCKIMAVKNGEVESDNACSIVIELTFGEKKFLFMGDLEKEGEAERSWNDVDVLKVGHHGSSTSSSMSFLEQVKPEIAVIMCGKDNDYGHPHKETLTSLKKIGATVYRTDLKGTILITSDGEKLNISTLDVSCDGNTNS